MASVLGIPLAEFVGAEGGPARVGEDERAELASLRAMVTAQLRRERELALQLEALVAMLEKTRG